MAGSVETERRGIFEKVTEDTSSNGERNHVEEWWKLGEKGKRVILVTLWSHCIKEQWFKPPKKEFKLALKNKKLTQEQAFF